MGKFSNAALRITAGALILDAGVKKLKADEGTYAFLQQMAATDFRNPDMHDEFFRPTQDGQQLANNIVMLGAGLALLGSKK